LGLLGFTLVQLTWSIALSLTTASKGAILVATSPIFGTFFAFLQGERPGWRAVAGILLSFAGVFLLLNNSLTRLNFGGGSLAGDLLFLTNAALWALYTTVAAPMINRHGPMKTVSYAALFGAIGLIPFGLYGFSQQELGPLPPWLGLNFLFVAVFSGAVGLSTYNAALARLGITRTIAYMYLVPVLAILGSILFLGESFSCLQALGASTVLAGIAQTRRAGRRKMLEGGQTSGS
jgi:drug/metabolite transporter (DMT)-like permease